MLTRSVNTDLQETQNFDLDITAAVAANATFPLCFVDYPFKVDGIEVHALGGFAADPANYWTIQAKQGATVLATYSTQTSAQGALVAGTVKKGVISATPSMAINQQLDVVFTKSGTAANFPAGSRVVIKGRLL